MKFGDAEYLALHPSKPCRTGPHCIAMIGFDVCWGHATPEEKAARKVSGAGTAQSRRYGTIEGLRATNGRRVRHLDVVDALLDLATSILATAEARPVHWGTDDYLLTRDPDLSLNTLAQAIHDDLGWEIARSRDVLRRIYEIPTPDWRYGVIQ